MVIFIKIDIEGGSLNIYPLVLFISTGFAFVVCMMKGGKTLVALSRI